MVIALRFSNEDIKENIKVIKSLEDLDILIDRISKTAKSEIKGKSKEVDFLVWY